MVNLAKSRNYQFLTLDRLTATLNLPGANERAGGEAAAHGTGEDPPGKRRDADRVTGPGAPGEDMQLPPSAQTAS